MARATHTVQRAFNLCEARVSSSTVLDRARSDRLRLTPDVARRDHGGYAQQYLFHHARMVRRK